MVADHYEVAGMIDADFQHSFFTYFKFSRIGIVNVPTAVAVGLQKDAPFIPADKIRVFGVKEGNPPAAKEDKNHKPKNVQFNRHELS
jgi:hypothetical protein